MPEMKRLNSRSSYTERMNARKNKALCSTGAESLRAALKDKPFADLTSSEKNDLLKAIGLQLGFIRHDEE